MMVGILKASALAAAVQDAGANYQVMIRIFPAGHQKAPDVLKKARERSGLRLPVGEINVSG